LSLGLFAGLVAVAGIACSDQSHKAQTTSAGATVRTALSRAADGSSAENGPLASVVPIKRSRGLLLLRRFAVAAVASSGQYLVWEAAGQEENPVRALLARNLNTGAVHQLALDPLPSYGLAVTPTAIIYAAQKRGELSLVAITLDGRHRRVLGRSLIAPFDARGYMVAWAEGNSTHQQVVVRNMRTGRQFAAMKIARCPRGRCYRIDRVTVASRGVVFDLGAIGQGYPSLIVRRGLRAAKPSIAKVLNDPQPDLARSSRGALYYWLQRGWMRWDFGEKQPQLTPNRVTGPWLLDDEHGRLLLLTGERCERRLVVRLRDGRSVRIPAPASTPISPRGVGPLCRELTSFWWTGSRLLLAWALTPTVSLESHEDAGLAGIVTAVDLPAG
jgi:hypothetical protein